MHTEPQLGLRYADLRVGMKFRSPGRTITDADLVAFAGLTGDFSELHTSDVYARSSQFARRLIAIVRVFGKRLADDALKLVRHRVIEARNGGRVRVHDGVNDLGRACA